MSFLHGNHYNINDNHQRMETVKSLGLFIADFLGISFTTLAIFHFTLEDVKGVTLLIGSVIYLGYKIYDSHLSSAGKKLENEGRELDIEERKAAIKKSKILE